MNMQNTNDKFTSEDLVKFRKQYPSLTSGDLQTFVLAHQMCQKNKDYARELIMECLAECMPMRNPPDGANLSDEAIDRFLNKKFYKEETK